MVQKRPFHATQLPGSQSSGRKGGEKGRMGGKKKSVGFFIGGQNEATRRGGPFRRQYPLTNAIWDDFPRVLLFLSLSTPPNISIICRGNLYFLPRLAALNESASFISVPVLLICIFFMCRQKECGDDWAGRHKGESRAEVQHLFFVVGMAVGRTNTKDSVIMQKATC